MVSIATRYLGMELRSPLVASASPLSETLDGVRRLEDAGVGAVVLFSLFEEQLALPPEMLHELMGRGAGGQAEAMALSAPRATAKHGPLEYLEHVRRAKEAVRIPIIASLNGAPGHTWAPFPRLLEEAGADAIELNLYHVPTDPTKTAEMVEAAAYEAVREVDAEVTIPVSVKLHPFFSSLPHAAKQFAASGADALVLFNRFYQPDVDLEAMRARPRLTLSSPEELRLRLRWVGILRDQVPVDLAVTGGVHSHEDALKAVAMGARVAMLCSALLKAGPGVVRAMNERMRIWLEARGYGHLDALHGQLASHADTRSAVQRAQYMRTLLSYESSERS